jgi:uncharacterized protein
MTHSPVLWEETIQPAASWSHVLKRGTALRLTDIEGGANVGALFYNFECLVERLNLPDTLKAQHIARLTKGFVLYSDMGRILLSITGDSVGWHDPLGGTSSRQLIEKKYGRAAYQEFRNDYHKNGRDSFLIELGKWGLGPRDLAANVNFFSRVNVDPDGRMTFVSGNSRPGDSLELRAEMNVLAILNTCQHPLDPSPKYQPKPVQLSIHQVVPAASDDACRISRPENGRGFTLTERYFL